MSDADKDKSETSAILRELDRLANGTTERLTAAVDDVDKIIAILTQAREQVATASDTHIASLTLTRLQNPVKEGFDSINNDLRRVDRVRKDYSKLLNKGFPARALPTGEDVMAKHPELINRAITWHLLREGQFNVASTFIHEAEQAGQLQEQEPIHRTKNVSIAQLYEPLPPTKDTDMNVEDANEGEDGYDNNNTNTTLGDAITTNLSGGDDEPMTEVRLLESHQLQEKFSTMYQILSELKHHNLLPAIQWAHQNTAELEARGSDLEFELCKRQYVYLVQRSRHEGGSDGGGLTAAMHYAQSNFPRFADRHAKEIAQLASALVFQSNLDDSPYATLLASSDADIGFDDIASSFTREFCSLLGLSAESPLYVAATAGAISLPVLLKYVEKGAAARTSWTTKSELPFETPLPNSMMYHSIFVCPVLKVQTTDDNPPMMLPCGHVLAKESLKNLARSHSRYKCPYCPVEGLLREAKQIIL